MAKNKIRVSICGSDYMIVGDEGEEYIRELAREVERRMEELMKSSSSVSLTMAAVLTAMNCIDEESKAIMSADNLRAQIKEYLADSARCRSEAEEARRELTRVRAELDRLRKQTEGAPQPSAAPRAAAKEPQKGFISLFDALKSEDER